MNEISKVLDRCIAKSVEHKSHPRTLSEIEKPSTEVTEREAFAMRRLAYSLLRLEMSVLLLEVNFLLFSIRERSRVEQPTKRIEPLILRRRFSVGDTEDVRRSLCRFAV